MQNARILTQAGADTVATTLQWSLMYMLHHPDVQEKIHQELDDNIGPGNQVTLNDKGKKPLFEILMLFLLIKIECHDLLTVT